MSLPSHRRWFKCLFRMCEYYKLHALLLLVLLGSAFAGDKPKLATLDIVGDSVLIDGVWEPDNPTKRNELVATVILLELKHSA